MYAYTLIFECQNNYALEPGPCPGAILRCWGWAIGWAHRDLMVGPAAASSTAAPMHHCQNIF